MRIQRSLLWSATLLTLSSAIPARAQELAPVRESGQTVTPVFEGWYRNPDGTYSLSFGYYNRNSKEVVEIPIGPNNSIKPGAANRGQPTRFEPRRHWGVFAVTVPANFGEQKVVWTLNFRGKLTAIPGSLKKGWEIDALQGEAGSGNTPPVLKFHSEGPAGSGPRGITSKPLSIGVNQPLTVDVYASDDGKANISIASDGRANSPVTLTWFKHQGPGEVTFTERTPRVDRATGRATTVATFSAPGEYLLRVRANDASGVTGAGHAQCCWSNGFVRVVVR